MRRILAIVTAAAIVAIGSPAWAAGMTMSVSGIPEKIFYGVPFKITISYVNPAGGAAVVNPHPMVVLSPTPGAGGLCNPALRASQVDLSTPTSTPITETEAPGGGTNCKVRELFDKTAHWNLPAGSNSNWSQVSITVRPAAGITTLTLSVVILDPDHMDTPYLTKTYSIPVATLPPPPSPVTPTTRPVTPTRSATAPATTAAPEPTETAFPEASPTDSVAPGVIAQDVAVKPAGSFGGAWLLFLLGAILLVIGGAIIVWLLRMRSSAEDEETISPPMS